MVAAYLVSQSINTNALLRPVTFSMSCHFAACFFILYLCLLTLIVCIWKKSHLVISWKLGNCCIFFHSSCYQQIKLPVETLPSVYSFIWKLGKEEYKKSPLVFVFPLSVQLWCVYVYLCIDIHICKCVFMCLWCFVLVFFFLGENFSPKHLVSLLCFPQKFTALTHAIFRHTELLFLSIHKIIISEIMQGIFIWWYK